MFIATRPLLTRSWARTHTTVVVCLIIISITFTWNIIALGGANLILDGFTFDQVEPEVQGGFDAQAQRAGTKALPLTYTLSWVGTINALLSDFIVVWRAWILFQHNVLLRYILAFLMTANVGINIVDCILIDVQINTENVGGSIVLDWVSDLLSLVVNMCATSLIAWKAWKHRSFLVQAEVHRRTRIENVLLLLIESGAIYCSIQAVYTALTIVNTYAAVVNLPRFLLIVIEAISGVAAAWYPIAVIILINVDRSPVVETIYMD
ncbi:hypothetical protein GYMLUDRAFT_737071 [Collybiopsis luxurians FD-317 M1]|uniref:Uncharacterized protein n=1 Tax=Collybiopsis luxurians FD-317 M1 TaxID=944289 RepID=A0A0D0CHZ8_9AGAR|nr:hypothetical protein GYMLUDRAFT_737071 [Collybiopsis luxurians FD-317 M1]